MKRNLPLVELARQNRMSKRTPGSSLPGWARYLVPSAADLIFILIVGTMCCTVIATRLLGDAGIGWHIRSGELILSTRSVPRTDPFSASMAGQRWYAWEWMYDAVIAVVHQRLGLNGVVFFSSTIIALTFALLFRLLLRCRTSLPLALFFLILSLSVSSIHFLARPHLVSWLFTLLWFQILDSSEAEAYSTGQRKLFWLPVIMLFWANLHGGFLLGFALLGAYLLSALIDFFRGDPASRQHEKGSLVKLGTVTVLSLVASLVNPYGFNLYVHLYRYLSDRWLMKHINEFLPPNFHGAPQLCFAAMLLLTILTLALARARVHLSHLFVIMLAVASGLYASRNLPVASILLTLIIAPLLSQVFSGAASNPQTPPRLSSFLKRVQSWSSRMTELELSLRDRLWPVAILVLGILVCAHGGRLGAWQVMNAHFDAKRFPVEAVDVIAERNIHEPIFTLDSWGGYLIYRLYPRTQVFVDDRHDLYGSEFFKQYLTTIRVEPGWQVLLNEKHVNWILVPKDSGLARVLRTLPAWQVVHEDGTAVLFRRV